MFGLVFYMDEDEVPVINPFVRISYGALHRSAWALVIGWLIFACTHGYGGAINWFSHIIWWLTKITLYDLIGFVQRFLSWKFFMPLSRLSYAAYLIHPIYIKVFFSIQRKPMYVSFPNLLTTFWGMLVPIFFLAAIISVVVEMPFLNLDKLLTSSDNSNVRKSIGRLYINIIKILIFQVANVTTYTVILFTLGPNNTNNSCVPTKKNKQHWINSSQ